MCIWLFTSDLVWFYPKCYCYGPTDTNVFMLRIVVSDQNMNTHLTEDHNILRNFNILNCGRSCNQTTLEKCKIFQRDNLAMGLCLFYNQHSVEGATVKCLCVSDCRLCCAEIGEQGTVIMAPVQWQQINQCFLPATKMWMSDTHTHTHKLLLTKCSSDDQCMHIFLMCCCPFVH